jgi:hypothetical protein
MNSSFSRLLHQIELSAPSTPGLLRMWNEILKACKLCVLSIEARPIEERPNGEVVQGMIVARVEGTEAQIDCARARTRMLAGSTRLTKPLAEGRVLYNVDVRLGGDATASWRATLDELRAIQMGQVDYVCISDTEDAGGSWSAKIELSTRDVSEWRSVESLLRQIKGLEMIVLGETSLDGTVVDALPAQSESAAALQRSSIESAIKAQIEWMTLQNHREAAEGGSASAGLGLG